MGRVKTGNRLQFHSNQDKREKNKSSKWKVNEGQGFYLPNDSVPLQCPLHMLLPRCPEETEGKYI